MANESSTIVQRLWNSDQEDSLNLQCFHPSGRRGQGSAGEGTDRGVEKKDKNVTYQ